MTERSPRLFTLQEANSLLPVIIPLMQEVLELRQKILARQAEVWPVIEKALGNGGSLAASQAVIEFDRLNSLVQQIQALGAVVKDINSGLIDFLAWRDGREVYLCWKLGEGEIKFWHELDKGFADRRPW